MTLAAVWITDSRAESGQRQRDWGGQDAFHTVLGDHQQVCGLQEVRVEIARFCCYNEQP